MENSIEDANFAELSKSFTFAGTVVGLPTALQSVLANTSNPAHHLIKREDFSQARTFSSGCTDAFSVFGFLAFLLALLDLLLELQGMGRRRKRSTGTFNILENSSILERNATLATYSIFRGFLNAMDAQNQDCSNLFICEAALEASKNGQHGNMIAKISSIKAEEWLLGIDEDLHGGTKKAGLLGAKLGLSNLRSDVCRNYFPDCRRLPDSYRFPGTSKAKENLSEDQISHNKRVLTMFSEMLDSEVSKHLYSNV